MVITRKESFYLLEKVIPVGIKVEKWIIEISLKHAVRAIHRAIANGVDHIVTAADMIGSSRTGLQTPSIKMGNEEMFFPNPDGIGHRKKPFDQGSFVLNPFDGNIG